MKQPQPIRGAGGQALLAAVLCCLAAGCATPPATAPKTQGPIFYPAGSEQPRLQFLTSYAGAEDLEGAPSKFASFIVGKAPPKQPIVKPYGLALSRETLYVCDTVINSIEILDLNKRKMRYFTPQGDAQLRSPINIAVDQDGTRYVADAARGQVMIYGADDSFQSAIGAKARATPDGKSEMEMKPTDVAVTAERLYVVDLKNQDVRVYQKATRQLLFTIPNNPAEPSHRLFSPTNLALDSQGRVYVADTGAFRVQQYDADGHYLRTFGRHGDAPGEFARPKGVAVDREGRVYVVDAATQVCQLFDPEGRLLLFFGEPKGSAASLNIPAKVIVDYEHVELFRRYAAPDFQLEYLVLITNQYGGRKVSVYGFGHKK